MTDQEEARLVRNIERAIDELGVGDVLTIMLDHIARTRDTIENEVQSELWEKLDAATQAYIKFEIIELLQNAKKKK